MRCTTPPPCDGVERMARPRTLELERLHLEHPIRAKVVRVLGEELRPTIAAPASRTRSSVSQRMPRVNARRIAVDAPPTVVALEDPLEDQVQERALLVALEALAREREPPARRGPPSARVAKRPWISSRPARRPGHRDGAVADVEDLRAGSRRSR